MALIDDAHTCITKDEFAAFTEAIILALRHDNPRFNEARFRRRMLPPG